MFDHDIDQVDDQWEAGFESGRYIVESRLGPYLSVFPRPKRYTRRLWHRVHELPIEDWQLQVTPLRLGTFCQITARLDVRYQPTLRYAREHLEHLPELSRHIRTSHEGLLRDLIEQEMRWMESDARWLEQGYGEIERAIERGINELMAVGNIQCRSRCRIEAQFASQIEINPEHLAPWSRHRPVYEVLLRRQRESQERLNRTQAEQILAEQRLRLQQEEAKLDLKRQEERLRKEELERELARLRNELAAEETRLAAQRESEARESEAQIRHAARLRELEMEADVREKHRRATGMDDMENHIKREIELLAMERQRLLLEEEVRETRLAKARGWVINAKKRFPLGESNSPRIVPGTTDEPENPD